MVGFIIKKLICIDFNMKIVIIHYNTPKLTIALLASLYKNNITENIIVFENSDKEPLNALSLFDYENKKVIFYPSLYIEPLKDDLMYYKIKIISILSIIISTFGVIYLSSSFFLRKKYKLNPTITNM